MGTRRLEGLSPSAEVIGRLPGKDYILPEFYIVLKVEKVKKDIIGERIR